MNNLTPQEKRAFENTADEVAYKCGDFTLYVQTVDDGYDYTIYDKHLRIVDGGVYDDPSISMSEAIDYFIKDFITVDMSSIEDRTAPLFDATEIRELADEIESSQLASTMFERQFEQTTQDAYAVYQLIDSDYNRNFRFEGIAFLEKNDTPPDKDNYQNVYTGEIPVALKNAENGDVLNHLWNELNINHPLDYTGHSLSVSDVVALKRDSEVSYHYVDSFGFKDVPFHNLIGEVVTQEHNEQMEAFAFNAKENHKDLFEYLSKDPTLKRTLEDVIAVSNLNENLDISYSYEQLTHLHSYCRDVWLKYEAVSLAQVADFACEALNQGITDIENISKFTRQEFYHAMNDDNVTALAKEDFLPQALHNEDRIFIDEENNAVTWIYFNPDSDAGGQFVENKLSYEDILDSAKATSNPNEFFNTHLASRAKQHLADVNTEFFKSIKEKFMSGTHRLSGCTTTAMYVLIDVAKSHENHLKSAEMSSEQNYNQIDGIINNENPKQEKAPKEKPSILKALKEVKKEVPEQKNAKEKDMER